MRITALQALEGERIPAYQGIAYWNGRQAVCYPVPVNLLVRYARIFWLKLQGTETKWTKEQKVIYQTGYDDGVKATQQAWKALILSGARIRPDLRDYLLQRVDGMKILHGPRFD
jgi:hypothetical protein